MIAQVGDEIVITPQELYEPVREARSGKSITNPVASSTVCSGQTRIRD
jgi:hypothetical protein